MIQMGHSIFYLHHPYGGHNLANLSESGIWSIRKMLETGISEKHEGIGITIYAKKECWNH